MLVLKDDSFKGVLAHVQALYDYQVKKADESILVIQKVEPCKALVSFQSSSLDFDGYYNKRAPSTPDEWDSQLAKFIVEAEAEHERLNTLHNANLPVMAHNKAVIEKASIFMRAIGIPGTYGKTEYVGRNKKPVHTSVAAGYISDLNRNAVITDGYDYAVSAVNDAIKRAKEFVASKRQEAARLEQATRAAADAKKAEMVIVHMRVKYGCEVEATPRDVLSAILEKNKYLRLAHYMSENRNDWNDGSDYAEMGLNGFSVETTEDQEIYDCVHAAIEDWQGDGRVFRDMEHNYGTIFAKVDDAGLMADYNTVAKMCQR